jgi:hypothetical protein
MDALIIGLIALNTFHKKQDQIAPEPAEFQPFDLRPVDRLYTVEDNSPSRTSDRERSYVGVSAGV